MASAPGPFFCATAAAAPGSNSSSKGPQHLILPTQEAQAAGFQIPAVNSTTNITHINHTGSSTSAIPAAYPITVTTAGQQPPAMDQSQQQKQPKQLTGLVPKQQLNAVNHTPTGMKKLFSSAKVGMKRPATEALLRTSPKSNNITFATKGGFTLPPDAVAPAPATPCFYSSASRATVAAQGIAEQRNKARSEGLGVRVNSAPSDLSGKGYKYRKVVGGKSQIPRSISTSSVAIDQTEMSPQKCLDSIIESRGYSNQKFCSLEGGYYCKPSPLQKASYGIKVVQTVRASDDGLLQDMLRCGISPNPCNNFGESVVHMVCRRGDAKLLKVLLDAGSSLQVTDDFGRTPLHDACWTAEPNFECVELILEADERLLNVVDCRGAPPLAYVKKDHWKPWIEFFEKNADQYWEPRDVSKVGEEPPPKLSQEAPHSQTVRDPDNAAPVEIAERIASGKLDARDYLKQLQDKKPQDEADTDTTTSTHSSSDESDSTMTQEPVKVGKAGITLQQEPKSVE